MLGMFAGDGTEGALEQLSASLHFQNAIRDYACGWLRYQCVFDPGHGVAHIWSFRRHYASSAARGQGNPAVKNPMGYAAGYSAGYICWSHWLIQV